MTVPPPSPAPFRILGETSDLIAVDKPPFLLVHPTKPGGPSTLWDRLRELLAYEIAGGGQVSLVNRLDRETSGIVLVAKTAAAARAATMSMARGEVAKEYLAVAMGWPGRDAWRADDPILRQGEVMESRVRLKRMVHPQGAPSLTEFRVLRRVRHRKHGPISLIHCIPKTGRTHQIRVHLAHGGHPVLGDKVYGPSEECYLEFIETGWTPALAERLWLPRHALHSCVLEIAHGGQHHRWESPLPSDLQELLDGEAED
jgi:23S rRNA pseudouridine1911/1915/1917 synthase